MTWSWNPAWGDDGIKKEQTGRHLYNEAGVGWIVSYDKSATMLSLGNFTMYITEEGVIGSLRLELSGRRKMQGLFLHTLFKCP